MSTPTPSTEHGWIYRLWTACLEHRRLVIVALVVTALGAIIDLSVPLITKAALDVATGEPAPSWGIGTWSIGALALALVGMAVVRYASQFTRRFTAGRLSLEVSNDLRQQLLSTLHRLDGDAQDTVRTGQVVSRSITDLQLVQGLLAMVPLSAGAIVQLLLAVVVMLWLSPLLTVAVIVIIPLTVLVAARSRKKLFVATWTAQQSAADLAQHVEETVTGVRVVKGFGQERRALGDLISHARTLYARRMRAGKINAVFAPTMNALPQLGMVLVIGLGGWLTLHDDITIGTFLVFVTYSTTLTALSRLITNVVVAGQLARAAVERVYGVIDHPTDPLIDGPPAPQAPTEAPIGLSFRGVDFAFPTAASTPVLRDLNLQISAGECVAVVGAAGSGKSAMGLLACRFHQPTSGSITLDTAAGSSDINSLTDAQLRQRVSIAFDDPFLYSDTIAANIALGGTAPVDRDAIRAAADAACATEFIDALPDGFDTVIGERGLTLSGGQRQRIALARALFADPGVLILDDATSAVDAQTEKQIFAALHRDRSHTVLVFAHRSSTLTLADRVAVLDGGTIVDIGTTDQLQQRSALFRSLMATDDPESVAATALPEADPADLPPESVLWPEPPKLRPEHEGTAPAAPPSPSAGGRGSGNATAVSGALGSMPATPEILAAAAQLPPANESPATDDTRVTAENRDVRLGSILRPVRILIGIAVAAIAVSSLLDLAFPTIARASAEAASRNSTSALWLATGAGLAVVAASWLATALMTITTTRAGERTLYSLRVRSFAHLQRLGLDYYERELSGRIMTRMTTDVDALSTFLQTGLSSAIVACATLVGVAAALVLTDAELGSYLLIAFVPLVLATFVFRRISARAYTRSRELISTVNADFQENVAGLRTSQAYRHTDAAMDAFSAHSRRYVRERMVAQRAIAAYFPFITFISDLSTAFVVAVGAQQVIAGETSAATLVAVVLYLGMLFGPVQQLSQVFDGYQQAAVGLRRIGDLLRTPSSVQADPPHPQPVPNHFDGRLQLSNVGFRYRGAQSDALIDIDVDLPAGSSLALVGHTGAGKSTIIKLIARYYDPNVGAITLDGNEIRSYALDDFRSRLGIVPQEAHLFSGTVGDNIAFGRPDASRTEIARAAQRVGALEVLAALPGGLNQPVGERGRGLSSGQRQLVALARAELVDPDLLLLDEATATLDQATERTVMQASDRLAGRRSTVIVAHRLATAARADRIAVVDGGRIVEIGTHRELVAARGRYHQLWSAGLSAQQIYDD